MHSAHCRRTCTALAAGLYRAHPKRLFQASAGSELLTAPLLAASHPLFAHFQPASRFADHAKCLFLSRSTKCASVALKEPTCRCLDACCTPSGIPGACQPATRPSGWWRGTNATAWGMRTASSCWASASRRCPQMVALPTVCSRPVNVLSSLCVIIVCSHASPSQSNSAELSHAWLQVLGSMGHAGPESIFRFPYG